MATIAFILQLSACVSVQQTVRADAAPVPTAGYVAGSFTTDKGSAFGFGLVNTETGEDYVMPFGQERNMPSVRDNELGMIQLPPGNYKIAYWVTYATLTKQREVKKAIDNPVFGAPFTVAPGAVVFLGSFSTRTDFFPYRRAEWSFRANRISRREAKDMFAKTYPRFADLPFSCRLCLP
ncbi:MAG TPA: hypothetical protein VEK77_08645 [Gemmatimonadales bacterium]|nr:hypothetical protein [Gemmatimonadales bacterium]